MTLPEAFIAQMRRVLAKAEADALIEAIAHEPCTTAIRLNRGKMGEKAVVPSGKNVPWCGNAMYVDERPQFTFDIDFQCGRYYVQDASSMFLSHVIKSVCDGPVRYLDLCAAPGGKTTAALDSLPPGSVAVACEIVPNRASVLRQNIVKWGDQRCAVVCDSPESIAQLEECFDVIAADVPCSGEGMFRKEQEAVAQWTPGLVKQCALRQKSIIANAWKALRKGGLLIYSTCTYNREENEEIAEYICRELGGESVEIKTEPSWNIRGGIDTGLHIYRFMPHLTRGEGLTLCVVKKNGETTAKRATAKKNKAPQAKLPQSARDWLTEKELVCESFNGELVASTSTQSELNAMLSRLHILKPAGVCFGSKKGKKHVPTHELAMSQWLYSAAFPQAEIDYKTAIDSFRGLTLPHFDNAPQGFVLLTNGGRPIAFANNLPGRANNLFPKSWRILNPHTPEQSVRVIDF